ncbi:hypothetical protein MMPV_003865 [Pyropia vietnamensis]
MGRFRFSAILFGLVGMAATVAAASTGAAGKTIADIASESPDLTLLTRALTDADLVSVVADRDASLTVFAPTDEAIVALARRLGYRGNDKDGAYRAIVDLLAEGDGDPIPLLSDILKYHVAEGAVEAKALVAAGGYKPLVGPRVRLADDGKSLIDEAPAVADAKLLKVDVRASNGIVHIISGVLLPFAVGDPTPRPTPRPTPKPTRRPGRKTIAEVVASTPEFSLLLAALEAADLVSAVADRDASLTVFAPTNDAFIRLSRTLGLYERDVKPDAALAYILKVLTKMGDGDPLPLLTRILTYHALPRKMSTHQLAGKTVQTLEGGRLHIRPWLRIVDAAPAVRMNAKINPGDVPAANGVIHVINGVLLPLPVCPAYKATYCRKTHRVLNAKACRCEPRRGRN